MAPIRVLPALLAFYMLSNTGMIEFAPPVQKITDV